MTGLESSVFVSEWRRDFPIISSSLVPGTTSSPEFSSIYATTNTNLFIITILTIDEKLSSAMVIDGNVHDAVGNSMDAFAAYLHFLRLPLQRRRPLAASANSMGWTTDPRDFAFVRSRSYHLRP